MGLIQKVETLKKKNFSSTKGLLYKCLSRREDGIRQAETVPGATGMSSPADDASPGTTQLPASIPVSERASDVIMANSLPEIMQERIETLAGGIESPAYLFRFIYESFNFKRGAFF